MQRFVSFFLGMINHVGLHDENMLAEAVALHPEYNLLPHRRCGTTGSNQPANRPPLSTRINSFKSPYGSKLDYINNLPNRD